jgi:hypothetical protein
MENGGLTGLTLLCYLNFYIVVLIGLNIESFSQQTDIIILVAKLAS